MEAAPLHLDRRTMLAGSLLLPGVAIAQSPPPTPLPAQFQPAAMRRDLALLGAAYAAIHPGLDRYLGRRRWAGLIEDAQGWAARPRSPGDFYLMLSRLTAAVKCGHSFPNPNNTRRSLRTGLLDGRNRVPFAFRWIDGQMVVTKALAPGVDIPAGSIVTRLDGMAPASLLRAMLPLARADGSNDAKRAAQLAVSGGERFVAFDVLRPLLDPQAGETVRLAYVAPDGRRHSASHAAMTETARAAARGGDDAFAGWHFAIEGGIGRLLTPSWATYNSKADWRGFINGAVDQLIASRARGLVLDLRGNEGGEDCGDVLLARLLEWPLQPAAFARRTRYRSTPPDLRPALDTWDPQFQDWAAQARGPDVDGWYDLVRPSDLADASLVPRGPRFAGPLVVLADAECSSATFQFCNLVQQAGLGRIVGSATGGNRRGINGGAFFFLALQETGLEVDLPIIGYFPAVLQPDAGVRPDVPVRLTAADIAAGRDPAMAAALRLLA
jgi:hypothetical protein